MVSASNIILCYSSYLPVKPHNLISHHRASIISRQSDFLVSIQTHRCNTLPNSFCGRHFLPLGGSVFNRQERRGPALKSKAASQNELTENGDGGGGKDWTASILLFCLWSALLYYVFSLAPNQTPSRDMYFLLKLLNLKGDDGFRMNEVLVSEWYIMGLWPLVYSMLLLPTGRSSKGSVPVWPFLVLSFFGGVYALLPYFIFWTPTSPPTEESELGKWPLNFLESKLTARILLAGGLGIFVYAAIAHGDAWKEFYQYFRESKFIHVMSLDFSLLSAFAPFWVYNDMTSRKWYDKGFWLLPLSAVPFLGPALYLALRPSLPQTPNLPVLDATEE